MTKTSHLHRIRIERRCGHTLLLFAAPESTQSLIAKHAEQFRGSRKQLLRRNVESECFCNPGDDVEADANVRCVENRAVGQSRSPQFRDVASFDLTGEEGDLFEESECSAQPVVELSFAPVNKEFTCYFVAEDGPRDRAVCVRSKETLVQVRRESPKQLALAD